MRVSSGSNKFLGRWKQRLSASAVLWGYIDGMLSVVCVSAALVLAEISFVSQMIGR